MIIYEPGKIGDALLENAYHNIVAAGDLDKLVCRDAQGLSGFLTLLQRPAVTFMEWTEQLGVWFLSWVSPYFDGAFLALWGHPMKRATKSMLRAKLHVCDCTLKAVPLILSLTKQPQLVPEHLKLGYNEVGRVPHLWDGQEVIALALTRENFAPVRARYAKLLENT